MSSAATDFDVSRLDTGAWHTLLPEFEFTLCHGQDNVRFLQGQLSCNIQKLTPTQSLRGALCNLKGRVITDLRALSDDTGILLLTRQGMQDKLITTLNKYRVFFKTSLEPLDNTLTVAGLGGPECSTIAASIGLDLPVTTDQVVALPGVKLIALPSSRLSHYPRYLCVLDSKVAAAAEALQLIRQHSHQLPDKLWQLADLRDGVVQLKPEQSEVFTPQLLNYDLNGVIDFKKGCYTGQEIVARMHYKAEAKRRLYHLRMSSAEVYESCVENEGIDVVNMVALGDSSVECLAIVNEKSLQAVANQATLTSF